MAGSASIGQVNQATGLGYTRANGITTPRPWPGRVSSSSQQTAPSLPRQSESGPLPSLRRSQARLQRLARMVRGTYAFSPSESRARGMMIFELHPNLNLISVSLRARRRRPGPPTKLQKPGELELQVPPWPARRRSGTTRPRPSTSRFPAPYV
jgi:hypothetical protein